MSAEDIWQRFKKQFLTKEDISTTEERCFWQVDIHSHLLPGVDDGVSNWEETLQCLQQFVALGITKVVTTPHVSRDWFPNKKDNLLEGLEQLKALVIEHELPIQVEIAAEYMLDDFFLELLENDQVLSFGVEKYVLIETGWSSAPFHLEDILFRMQAAGFTPVLAHPERYKYYQDFELELEKLRHLGCLFQLNLMSLTGRYGEQARRQARQLLGLNWVDFVGSDLHRPADLPTLKKIFATAEFGQFKNQPLRNQYLGE
ncbi:MAG: histidinol-phosphatase [Siphonobacter sp.]